MEQEQERQQEKEQAPAEAYTETADPNDTETYEASSDEADAAADEMPGILPGYDYIWGSDQDDLIEELER